MRCRYGTSELGVLAEATATKVLENPGLIGFVLPGFEMAAYVIQGEGVFGEPAVRAAVGSLAVFSPEGALRLSNRGGVSLDVSSGEIVPTSFR